MHMGKFWIYRFLAMNKASMTHFEILTAVIGRQDYRHSIRLEIFPKNSGLPFILCQILNFSIFGSNKAYKFMAHFGV